jgi:hypothetical protein
MPTADCRGGGVCASPLSPTSPMRVPTKAPTGQARGPKAHDARSTSHCRRRTPAACHMLWSSPSSCRARAAAVRARLTSRCRA